MWGAFADEDQNILLCLLLGLCLVFIQKRYKREFITRLWSLKNTLLTIIILQSEKKILSIGFQKQHMFAATTQQVEKLTFIRKVSSQKLQSFQGEFFYSNTRFR